MKSKINKSSVGMLLLKGRTLIVLIVLLVFFSIKADNFMSANTMLLVAKHIGLWFKNFL